MLIKLCGFANRKPNKINDLPIAMNIRDGGARNEQELELGESRPLINTVCYFLLTFFLMIRIATAFVYLHLMYNS